MARPHSKPAEIAALISRIEASRVHLGGHVVGLREKLDLPKRLKDKARATFSANPLAWFGGSLGAGFFASRLFRRPKKTVKKTGWFAVIASTVFALLKPTIQNLVVRELQRRFVMPQAGAPTMRETRFTLPKP